MRNLKQHPLQPEIEELRREVAEVVLDPERWLRTPNDLLGGREPLDLAQSKEGRQMVRDLIEAIKHGMVT